MERLRFGKSCFARMALCALAAITAISAAGQPGGIAPSHAAGKIFRLDGGEVTYAMGVSSHGELQTVYWGRRLAASDALPTPTPVSFAFEIDDTEQEFPGWGGGVLDEPALKITFPDGNRDLVLHYQSEKTDGGQLLITLRDISRDIYVTLHYKLDAETGILARWATIENRTNENLMVAQAESAIWNLPAGTNYSLRYLAGRWGGEFQLQSQKIEPGSVVLESRRGYTGHQSSPWFAIERGGATETEGSVWFGVLAWSGGWRITVQQDPMRQVRIVGGIQSVRFWLSPCAWPATGSAGLLRWLFPPWIRCGLAAPSSLREHADSASSSPSTAPSRFVQLVGSHGIQYRRARAGGVGGEGREHRGGALRHG